MFRASQALIALVALCAVLAACGGGDSAADAETVAPGSDPTTTIVGPEVTTTVAGTTAAPDAPRVKDGDRVRVHYTGMLEDGEVFDSSQGRDPLEFVVASGQVIAGFDDAVRGLAVGETRTQRIEPVDGYGETNPELIIEAPIDQLPEGVAAGDQLQSSTGQAFVVLSIDEATGIVQLDANHFLAGKVLIFDVELVEIVPAG